MKEILFFSNNLDKINEIKNLFKKHDINVLSLKDVSLSAEPKETKKSFIENAKIKSEFGFKKTNIPCFADDSGICIDALGGGPGVRSRRFLEKFINKKECFKEIQKKIIIQKTNKAFFQSSICLTTKRGHNIVFEGKAYGTISRKISGKRGFGYDPIFIPEGFTKTYSEMSLKQKNNISHRSIAINKLISFFY